MNNQHDLLGGERRMEGGDELTWVNRVPVDPATCKESGSVGKFLVLIMVGRLCVKDSRSWGQCF